LITAIVNLFSEKSPEKLDYLDHYDESLTTFESDEFFDD